MRRLSDRDYDAALSAIRELHSCLDWQQLPRFMVDLMARLVPCEIATYSEIDRRNGEMRSVHNYHGSDASRHFPAFIAHVHEHAPSDYAARTGIQTPLRISDFLTQAQFKRLGLYNEFYRVFGIRFQMVFFPNLGSDFQLCVGLQRCYRDFSERERSLLTLVSENFSQAWKNARKLASLESTGQSLSAALSAQEQGVIAVDGRGAIKWMTPPAAQQLAEFFPGRHPTADRLPHRLQRWLQQAPRSTSRTEGHRPASRFEVILGNRRLDVSWLRHREEVLILMTGSTWGVPHSNTICSTLTPREQEVFGCLCNGKSNVVIGQILEMSPNTVRKHLERIYAKLGVENRTAAIAAAATASRLPVH